MKVKVAIVAKLKNGILFEAAQKLGSQAALARYIGVPVTELGRWMNFQDSPFHPQSKRSREFWQTVENKLFELTSHTLEEIFPSEIRTKAFLKREKKIASVVDMPIETLLTSGAIPQLIAAPDELLFREEGKLALSRALGSLSLREEDVIRMRYGLEPYDVEYTFDEIAERLKVIRARIGQIEKKALRKLRHPFISHRIKPWIKSL